MSPSPRPKISVVTPSFNQAAFVEDTLQSVLEQQYPNLEYIVIDGGSTDGSVERIRKYEGRLHYWVSEKDRGHAHALNKGFAKTSGEIMAWINSDDCYLPWTFRVVADVFEAFPQVEWIVGFNSCWSADGALLWARRNPKNIYDYLLRRHSHGWLQQESVFWRRRLWDRAGGRVDEGVRLMVDGDLWCRFFLHAELHSVDCILGGYRVHGANRAVLQERQVVEDMERAVQAMAGRCGDAVLRTARQLRAIEALQRTPLLGSVVGRLAPRLGPVRRAGYRNLYYHEGAWRERLLPFSLVQQSLPAAIGR